MSIIRFLVAVALAIVLVGYGGTEARTQSSPPPLADRTSRTFVDQYCIGCHNQRLMKERGLER
jgi:hypothetical protein